jgi:proteasome lid subunit RPN8/RPN11
MAPLRVARGFDSFSASERATILVLPSSARDAIAAWSHAAYPREACGVLVGREIGGARVVERAELARNMALAADRYELDARDLVNADSRARAQSLEIVGIWHSHPDRAAIPSSADRANAWRGWSYAIVFVDAIGSFRIRSWRVRGEAFDEEPIETDGALSSPR